MFSWSTCLLTVTLIAQDMKAGGYSVQNFIVDWFLMTYLARFPAQIKLNIMIVNMWDQQLRIKMTDFGESSHECIFIPQSSSV